MTRRKWAFPWCGVKRGRSAGETRPTSCRKCKAHSAPSTPRGSRSRSRSRSPTPRGQRIKAREWCLDISSRSTATTDNKQNKDPKMPLPIDLHPDHKPRKVRRGHTCKSPRRGCHDHRCHDKKEK
ncbi:hypothetical protein M758_4G228300 [Ceratodon purpureus]|nr:hypothetical protein M758_4G228300 [Ceratodon purpureus]